MTRAKRIVLTVLILWTWLHVCLWSLNGFCIMDDHGLWPFGWGRIVFHLIVMPGNDLPDLYLENSWSTKSYSGLEFILYVGFPWTVFGLYHLLKGRKDEKDSQDSEK